MSGDLSPRTSCVAQHLRSAQRPLHISFSSSGELALALVLDAPSLSDVVPSTLTLPDATRMQVLSILIHPLANMILLDNPTSHLTRLKAVYNLIQHFAGPQAIASNAPIRRERVEIIFASKSYSTLPANETSLSMINSLWN
ncbi:hypothetical protein C8J57DRAFT_1497358 [Mycena rebaudengoi]|nr:hypothetical protein C8J57DRAFT_1497358 [Mycena rebaudengoi]